MKDEAENFESLYWKVKKVILKSEFESRKM